MQYKNCTILAICKCVGYQTFTIGEDGQCDHLVYESENETDREPIAYDVMLDNVQINTLDTINDCKDYIDTL